MSVLLPKSVLDTVNAETKAILERARLEREVIRTAKGACRGGIQSSCLCVACTEFHAALDALSDFESTQKKRKK